MICSPCGGVEPLFPVRPLFPLEVMPNGMEVRVPREREFGVRNPRKLLDPKLPSQKEVDEHDLSHLPYRNWCPFCVAGKGKLASHVQQSREDGLPENPFGLLLYEYLGKPARGNTSGKRKEREDDDGFSVSDEKGHRSSFRQEGL